MTRLTLAAATLALAATGCGHLAHEETSAQVRGSARADENDVQVSLDQVPPQVRAAIEARLGGAGRLNEIERSTTSGITRYEVDTTRPDGHTDEFVLSSDGTLLGEGDDEDTDGEDGPAGEDHED